MILERLFAARSAVVDVGHPRDPVIASWLGGGSNTTAGVSVTPDSAMRLAAVYACVRILATSIASLPLELYRKVGDGDRELADKHPLYSILHTQPNRWQTSFEWREMMAGHLALRGNGYSYIEYRGDGAVGALIPLHPDRTRPFWAPDGSVAYEYENDKGVRVIYLQDEILHLRGMSFDGLKGFSPIEYMRETLGLSLAADQFGSAFFGNGTVVSGVLQTDDELSDVAYERLKTSWAERHQGTAQAYKPAILEQGMKWQALSVAPNEAQFIETRKFQRSEIAMIFGVPPHMIGDVEKATSWGTGIEQQGIGFVVYSLRPWLVRIEQAFKRDLLNTSTSAKIYAEFNVDGLLRGDSKARGEFYKLMFSLGAISQNEIRRLENLNRIENGDKYFVPLNMIDTQDVGNKDPAADPASDPAADPMPRFHLRMLRQAIDRIVTCEIKAVERAIEVCGSDKKKLESRIVEFYAGHADFMRRHLAPVAAGLTDPLILAHTTTTLRGLEADLNSDLPVEELQATLSNWRATRSAEITQRIAASALEEMLNEA